MSDPEAAAIALVHARLIEALHFYGDADTYFGIGIFTDPPCGGFAEDFSVHRNPDYPDGDERPGKRAREALEQWFRLVDPEAFGE